MRYSLNRLLNAGEVKLRVIALVIAIGQPDEKLFGIVEVAHKAFGGRSKEPSALVIGQFVPAGRLRWCIVDPVTDIERVSPNGTHQKVILDKNDGCFAFPTLLEKRGDTAEAARIIDPIVDGNDGWAVIDRSPLLVDDPPA